jgi:hypothetical protein
VLIDAREHVPGERRLEAAAHDLDFRQLGHMVDFSLGSAWGRQHSAGPPA